MITIEDGKGLIHVFNTDFLKEIEFTKGGINIIMKDGRSDKVFLKAKRIRFS